MAIKEDFRRYREARRMIQINLQRLEGIRQATDTVSGSSPEWPYIKHAMTVSGRDAAEERYLMARIADDRERCRRVETAIAKAPNGKLRDIIELHYVEGVSWEDIAELLAGDDPKAPTGAAIRKMAQRFLDGL